MFSRMTGASSRLRAAPARTLALCRPRTASSPLLPLLRHRQQQQRRNVTNFRMLVDEARQGSLKRHWLAIATFVALISTVIGTGGYAVYLYNELVEKPLSVYPPLAASQIKRALYYASRGEMGEMAAAFKAAIQAAEDAGMHPLSDEVAGLKIECAQLLLKMQEGKYAPKAAEVLEHVLDEAVAGAEYFEKEERWEDRTKVLKRAVLLGYKIGEIYQELGKDKNAEEAMSWSTETLLKETKRREDAEVVGDDDWFDDIAMSACFEKLAQLYEETAQYYLATPLYLKAVAILPAQTCHSVTLMNNVAAVLSRQKPPADAEAGRARLLQDAQKWAEKSLEINANVRPPIRTEECDQACVAATHNLGEIARMLGDKKAAADRFNEALSLAKALGLTEGIEAAKEGLENIRSTDIK